MRGPGILTHSSAFCNLSLPTPAHSLCPKQEGYANERQDLGNSGLGDSHGSSSPFLYDLWTWHQLSLFLILGLSVNDWQILWRPQMSCIPVSGSKQLFPRSKTSQTLLWGAKKNSENFYFSFVASFLISSDNERKKGGD